MRTCNMIIVGYELQSNQKVARSESLYVASMTAAKQLLSRKIPQFYHLIGKGNWKQEQQFFTKRFVDESGRVFIVKLWKVLPESPVLPETTTQLTFETL